MNKMYVVRWMLFVFSSVFFNTVFSQSPDIAKLNMFFDRLDEKHKAMGSLLILKDGKEVYSRTIGYAQVNGEDMKPLTAASRYRIGSITKTFTATIVFQLVEEGKLKLTDKLAQFFPQIPNADKITIQHLLAHRSGVADVADGGGKSKPRTQSEILATITRGGSHFEPDSKYEYSNAGFVMLGYIVEKIVKKPYAEVLKERITKKIGLNDTYSGTGFVDSAKNESYSYHYAGRWIRETEAHLSNPGGAGSIVSTPADLAKFIRALFEGRLISKSSVELMMQKSLGMEAFTHVGKTFYGHAGGIDNFGSWLVYLPEEKLVLAYATNAKVYPVAKLIEDVFTIYANKPFEIPTFESLAISTEMLDQYVGVYSMPDAPKFTVKREGNMLTVQMADRPPMGLEAVTETKFKVPNTPIEITFDAANKQMSLSRGGGGGRIFTKEN